MNSDLKSRVLSIQSHVVSGYVGNKSAVFPLQILGFDVDAINSVQFSNHTQYKHFRGQILDAKDLGELFEGLVLNNLDCYSHILTGYIASSSFLLKVVDVVKHLKVKDNSLVYVCDPVLGDNGKMYVPENLLEMYITDILPIADILLPNQFEAEKLSGITIHDESSALEVINVLHSKGPKTVVLTSTNLGNETTLVCYASSRSEDGSQCRIRVNIPRVPAVFVGTGDLFAALWLAWSSKYPSNLKEVCENVQSTMQLILRRTYSESTRTAKTHAEQSYWAHMELKLIQSRLDIENPTKCVTAEVI